MTQPGWVPVQCQLPNKPDTRQHIGYAPNNSSLDFKEVGKLCGAQDIIDGKLIHGKHLVRWCLVALKYPIGKEAKPNRAKRHMGNKRQEGNPDYEND